MEVTLVVIINNTKAFVSNLLSSLNKIKCNQIFLLNGMMDFKAIKMFESYQRENTDVRIIKSEKLLRYPIAMNTLLHEVKTKYVFIMDSDILTTNKDIMRIHQFMEDNLNYGAVQGLLLYPQTNTIQSSGHLFYEFYDHYGHYKSIMNNLKTPLPRQALSAGFAMYPMDIVKSLGAYDSFYMHTMSGVEFSTRIHLSGHNVCCLPTAKGYHFHSLFRKNIKNKPENGIGKYWSTYGRYIKDDLISEIRQNSLFKDFAEYDVVDCSTIYDFNKFLNLLDIKVSQTILKTTDLLDESIILHNVVPHSILKSKNKILWICTNFTQISNNHVFFSHENRINDYIIDMSGNIIPVSKLIKS